MDGLKWVFEMVDQMSGPAKAAASSLSNLTTGLGRAISAYGKMESAAKAAAKAQEAAATASGRWRLSNGRFVKEGTPGASWVSGRRGGGGMFGGDGGGGSNGLGGALAGLFGPRSAAALSPLAAGMSELRDIASETAKTLYDVGASIVKTSVEKQALRINLETILGDRAVAKDVGQRIRNLADTTPFSQKQVALPAQTLISARYAPDKAFEILNALGDVSALKGFDPEALSNLAINFAKMNGDERLSLKTLNSINLNSGGLVGRGMIFDELAQQMGIGREEVKKQISAGKVDAEQGTQAILEAIRKNLSGGELGGAMKKFGQEIPGLLSTLKDTVSESIIPEVDDSHGMRSLRGFLRSMTNAAMGAKPELEAGLGALIDSVFGGIFGHVEDGAWDETFRSLFADIAQFATDASVKIDAFFAGFDVAVYGILSSINEARPAFRELWNTIMGTDEGGDPVAKWKEIGDAVVSVAKAVGFVVASASNFAYFLEHGKDRPGQGPDAIDQGWNSFWNGGDNAATAGLNDPARMAAENAGLNIAQGLANGMAMGGPIVNEASANLANGSLDTLRDSFQIKSPSRVMMGLGDYVAQGFAMGIDGGAGRVDSAMGRLMDPPEAGLSLGSGMGGLGGSGGGITVNLNGDMIFGDGTSEEAAESILQRIAEGLQQQAITMGYAAA